MQVWFKIMDPLADAYGRLTPEDKGQIDPEVREKAIKETRVFLIEITLASIIMLVFSLF